MTRMVFEGDGHTGAGKLCSLESRLERLAEERPVVIGRLLYALIDLHNVGDAILRDCDVLEDDEWTAGGD